MSSSARTESETRVHESRVRRELFKVIAALPDPEWFAARLPEHLRVGLIIAFQNREGLSCYSPHVDVLRSHGLVEYGGNNLTVFGVAVRQAIIASVN